ncbi:MAG: hypothetical protein RLZZ387_4206 [Chloroflexota bacterium]|jgi:uncharacterized protein (DUF1684 family)
MSSNTTPYEHETLTWRAAAETALRAEDGWLTVVGLCWLRPGENTVGSGSTCDIALAEGSAPASVGKIDYDGTVAVLHPDPDAGVHINGAPAGSHQLRSDIPGPPDAVTVGSVTFFLIERGGRLGVRVRDTNSPTRRGFGGRRWFPVREEYRVAAAFVPYDPPRQVPITNILGDVEDMPAAGQAIFTLGGAEIRLEALARKDGGLFFIFCDDTSGKETYPAARFLNASAPQDGHVTLDFNRAVSPPCAFTAYATCPLPPQQNHLSARIEAGEIWASGA